MEKLPLMCLADDFILIITRLQFNTLALHVASWRIIVISEISLFKGKKSAGKRKNGHCCHIMYAMYHVQVYNAEHELGVYGDLVSCKTRKAF